MKVLLSVLLFIAVGCVFGLCIMGAKDKRTISDLQKEVKTTENIYCFVWDEYKKVKMENEQLKTKCGLSRVAVRYEILDGNDIISSITVPLYLGTDGKIYRLWPVEFKE
jgi:hypothetical protein